MKLPSVYVYGMPIHGIDRSIYGGLFGNATRSVGLAFNLARIGHKVILEVENDFRLKAEPNQIPINLKFVRSSERNEFLQSSDILLISSTNIESLLREGKDPYLFHEKKVYATCFDLKQSINLRHLNRYAKHITFNNTIQKNAWDSRLTLVPSTVVSYGVNEYQYVDDAITCLDGKAALWMGAIRRVDMLQRLIKFAHVNRDCRVSVVTRVIYDDSNGANIRGGHKNPYADFARGADVSVFNRVVKELCGMETPNNINFLGPMEGENHKILGEHSIGLDFSRFPAQEHDNTKILDYLRSGMAVICDKGTPSYRYVEETGHGCVLNPHFTDEEIRSAFKKCSDLISLQNRRAVAEQIALNYGWDKQARIYSNIILEAYKVSVPKSTKRLLNFLLHCLYKGVKKFLIMFRYLFKNT